MVLEKSALTLRRDLLPDGIARSIREAVATGELRPGDHLVEADLAETLGVSRAPLREALRQLIAEGVLVGHPHRGTFVRELTTEDIREIYSLRGALESLAVEILVDHITKAQLAGLDSILGEMKIALNNHDTLEVVNLDMRIHETLCRYSGHSRLYNAWKQMGTQLKSFFAAADPLYEDDQIIERHRQLIEAIASRDKAKAVEVIQEHIFNAADRLLSTGDNLVDITEED